MAGIGKVGNLRAMFENKGESSPPDRGRSPGIPVGESDSPRPLSKVRTSFVAVEKGGRIGLQRDRSHDSAISVRKASDESNPAITPQDSSVTLENDKMPARTSLKDQPIPESPRTEVNPDTATKVIETNGGGKPEEKLNGTTHVKPKSPTKDVKEVKAAENPARTATTAPVAAKATTKPVKPEAAKVSQAAGKSTPRTTTTRHEKTQPERPAKPATSTPTATTVTPTKPKVNPASLNLSPANAAFVKPKVKSPTRPVRLPAGLTTHTAASVSKLNQPRQSNSRPAVSAPPAKPAARQSTTSGRRPSTTSSRRPSVGPPPKQPVKDHPPTRRDKGDHEGFLARMMRPTQASSSKTAEKMPVTPPRKTAASPGPKKSVHSAEKPVKAAAAPRHETPKQEPVAGKVVSASHSSASEVSADDTDAEHTVANVVSADVSLAEHVSTEDNVAARAPDVAVEHTDVTEQAVTAAEHAETVEEVMPAVARIVHTETLDEIVPTFEHIEHADTVEEFTTAAKDIEEGVGHVPETVEHVHDLAVSETLKENVQTPDKEHNPVLPEHAAKELEQLEAEEPSTMVPELLEKKPKTDFQAEADLKTEQGTSVGPVPVVNGDKGHDTTDDKETSVAEHAETAGKETLSGEQATVAEA